MAKPNLYLSVYDCLKHFKNTDPVYEALGKGDIYVWDGKDSLSCLTKMEDTSLSLMLRTCLTKHQQMLDVRMGEATYPHIDNDAQKKYWLNDWHAMNIVDDAPHIFQRLFITGASFSKLKKLLPKGTKLLNLRPTKRNPPFNSETGSKTINNRWARLHDEKELFKDAYKGVVSENVQRYGKTNVSELQVKHTDILEKFLRLDASGSTRKELAKNYIAFHNYQGISSWDMLKDLSNELFRTFGKVGESFVIADDNNRRKRIANNEL